MPVNAGFSFSLPSLPVEPLLPMKLSPRRGECFIEFHVHEWARIRARKINTPEGAVLRLQLAHRTGGAALKTLRRAGKATRQQGYQGSVHHTSVLPYSLLLRQEKRMGGAVSDLSQH